MADPFNSWWNNYGVNAFAGVREKVVSNYGLSWDQLNDTEKRNLAVALYNQQHGIDYGGKSPEEAVKAGFLSSGIGESYKKGLASLQTSIKNRLGTAYDKTEWTDAKIEELWKSTFSGQSGDPTAAAGDVLAKIQDDFATKLSEGKIDKTGNLIDQTQRTTENFKAIADKLGLKDVGEDYLTHFQKVQRENNLTDYEVEQLMKNTSEYGKAEVERLYDEYEPTLDARFKEELANIGILDKKSREMQTEAFKEITPEITRAAGLLGGRDRSFTTESLAKAGTDLEKQREKYMVDMESIARQADVERRYAAKTGEFEAAGRMVGAEAKQGANLYGNILKTQSANLQQLSQLSVQRQSAIVQQQQQMYDKQIKREMDAAQAASKAAIEKARKKAGKYGLLFSTLQGVGTGILAGAAGGPGGMIAGGLFAGVAGYAGGTAQNKANQYATTTGIGGVTNPYASNIDWNSLASTAGKWGGSLYSGLSNQWGWQTGYKPSSSSVATTSQFDYLR